MRSFTGGMSPALSALILTHNAPAIGLDGQQRSLGVVGQDRAMASMTTTGITWILRVAGSGQEVYRLTMGDSSRTLRIPYQG